MTETITRRQTVDFLGFLRSQLSGLQGIPTLCYELIQNADDVKDYGGKPGATRITFDVCDDALYVENDGLFREIDFDRMERVSWGNKREEAGTTGAFGIGFISVYQITDSPEILSSGRHWRFQPNAPENERILETKIETEFTRFRLPWAYEVSNIRAELRIPPVDKTQLDNYVIQINQAIEAAALFLKQVTTLEIKRSGNLVRRIETLKDGNGLLVADGDQTIVWRILQGHFDIGAARMRGQYGNLIEEKRQPVVKIAIPEMPLENGLLYAFLPSETHTGLPFHINADFYPSQDRKRIPFEQSYQSQWNHLAIECAADTLAAQVDEVLDLFEPQVFWEFVECVKQASDASTLSPIFARFWNQLKPQIRAKPSVLTASEKHLTPPQTIYLDTEDQINAGPILENIGIDTVHPDLRHSRNLLIETGVRLLKISDMADGLSNVGLSERTELSKMPKLLQSEENWRIFWIALNALWERTPTFEKAKVESQLKQRSIAFGSDGALWPPSRLFIAENNTQQLFSRISSVIWYVKKPGDVPIPSSFTPVFSIQEGIDVLARIQSSLENLWAEEKFSPKEMYDWLEGFRNEIALNPQLKQNLRSCAIWPTADCHLKPLEELYLAGDFDDPLELAQLVNVDALGGRREFLESTLSVSRLDFVTYVRDWVPLVIKTRKLDRESRFRLLKVLAENLGKLQGQTDLQKTLAELELVWCGDDLFLPARSVYFDSKDIRIVLEVQNQIAQLPEDSAEAIQAFYKWLGVAQEPRPTDIVARICNLVEKPPVRMSLQAIETIFSYLASKWIYWNDEIRNQFNILRKEAWLPGTKKAVQWFDAASVYSIYSRYLFDSQGNFLKIDRQVQQNGSDLIKFLGIKSEPTTEQVVKHLLFSSENRLPITQEIYVHLTRYASDPVIHQLRGKDCLYLAQSDGSGKYFKPAQVFWEQHKFGYYRFRLGTDFGRFKDLLDQLEVKTKPDSEDAISVLIEISDDFGKSNLPLTDRSEVTEVVINCWQLLSDALKNGEIDAKEIKKRLGNKKTIPDSRHILEPPLHLFFEDRPGWGSKFELIKNSLASRVEGAWPAMEAAGVQRLSKAIATEIHQCINPTQNELIKDHVMIRRLLVQRVIEAHRAKGVMDFDLASLDKLGFVKADQIDIVRVFTGFGRQEPSQLETVDAIHLDGTLYFYAEDSQYPWKGIARELAYVLYPSGELSSLGMELKEIFSQSVQDANATLDEYGYPRVQAASTHTPESTTVHPGDATIETGTPTEHKDETGKGTETGESNPPTGGTKPPKDTPEPPTKPEKRKTSRLVSYVYPDDATTTKTQSEEAVIHRTKVGQLGVEKVMAYEIENDRTPTDMETVQVHHPGYDIKSIDKLGRARYIEVKTFSGLWDSQNPAQMTKTEFDSARELGDSYWLYVVEQVETDNVKIYPIRNPANRADYYLYDYRWEPLVEKL
jgi:hypothetical protein